MRAIPWVGMLAAALAACSDYSNKPAAEAIAAAVKTYEHQTGRYPARLEDLVPNFLRELPKASSKHFVIAYAVEPGETQCWVVYQVHRDRYEEFDCAKERWTNVEIEDSHVFRHPNQQMIKPEYR